MWNIILYLECIILSIKKTTNIFQNYSFINAAVFKLDDDDDDDDDDDEEEGWKARNLDTCIDWLIDLLDRVLRRIGNISAM